MTSLCPHAFRGRSASLLAAGRALTHHRLEAGVTPRGSSSAPSVPPSGLGVTCGPLISLMFGAVGRFFSIPQLVSVTSARHAARIKVFAAESSMIATAGTALDRLRFGNDMTGLLSVPLGRATRERRVDPRDDAVGGSPVAHIR